MFKSTSHNNTIQIEKKKKWSDQGQYIQHKILNDIDLNVISGKPRRVFKVQYYY